MDKSKNCYVYDFTGSETLNVFYKHISPLTQVHTVIPSYIYRTRIEFRGV